MKQIAILCVAFFLALAARGGPNEAAVLAAMRLSDVPSYSWTATISDDARTYDIDGKTARGGFTRVKMPVINAVRLRLGRSAADTQIEAIFRGNVKCVLLAEDKWKLVDELPFPMDDDEFERIAAAQAATGPGSIMSSGAQTGVPGMGAITRSRRNEDLRPKAYSNLQLAISHPHEELGVMVSSHASWNVEGDVISGTLTDLGAQLLLVHDGQKEIEPLRAAGTFKLWMRNGLVVKYQVALEGILSVTMKTGGRQKIEVRQTMNTVIRDIGTTKFEVPDEARRKLGA